MLQLLGILNQYGVTESEAVGGCAAKFKGEFGKHGDQQASLALSNQVSALKRKYPRSIDPLLSSFLLRPSTSSPSFYLFFFELMKIFKVVQHWVGISDAEH